MYSNSLEVLEELRLSLEDRLLSADDRKVHHALLDGSKKAVLGILKGSTPESRVWNPGEKEIVETFFLPFRLQSDVHAKLSVWVSREEDGWVIGLDTNFDSKGKERSKGDYSNWISALEGVAGSNKRFLLRNLSKQLRGLKAVVEGLKDKGKLIPV